MLYRSLYHCNGALCVSQALTVKGNLCTAADPRFKACKTKTVVRYSDPPLEFHWHSKMGARRTSNPCYKYISIVLVIVIIKPDTHFQTIHLELPKFEFHVLWYKNDCTPISCSQTGHSLPETVTRQRE